MAIHFIYLVLASIVQVGWLYNVKRISRENWHQIKTVAIHKFIFWKNFSPILIYIALSISTIILLTHAMEKIPTAVAYAVWSGLVIVLAAIIDQVVMKEKTSILKYFYICLIIGGIVGLRLLNED